MTAFLTFLTSVLTAVPELIAEVEKLIVDLKSTPQGPLATTFAQNSADADAKLYEALKK